MTASGTGCVGGHSAFVATVTEECFSPSPSLRDKQCQAWLSTYTGEKGNNTVSTVAGHENVFCTSPTKRVFDQGPPAAAL